MGRSGRTRLVDRLDGPPTPAPPSPPQVKHVWVTNADGRHAGLLLRWRKVASGWQGYVTHPVLGPDGWALVDEWLPAEQLEPA